MNLTNVYIVYTTHRQRVVITVNFLDGIDRQPTIPWPLKIYMYI